MPRKWKKSNNRRPKPRDPTAHGNGERGESFIQTVVENGNFKMETYYAAQGLHNRCWSNNELVECVSDEEKQLERLQWKDFMGKVLPASFRIGKDVPEIVRNHLEAELEELLPTESHMVQKLGFLPHAYQLGLDRNSIRKKPELAKLHQWLKEQSQSGFITRQETVSMIPPVVLAPHPTDWIIDLCAAPGSKTSQLMEDLGRDGCIVANDANSARAHMLVNQLRRIMYNNPEVLVTACQAQLFPTVTQFDRVLCDVPCSGDGTSRKNIHVWTNWSQRASLGLHALQLSIAWKAASQLLKVHGFMCYSTCSLNPMEDEAVVAELLRLGDGNLELVQLEFPNFRTRPGMSTWKVFCEEKSRRQMKDDNAKMRERRQQWRDKSNAESMASEEPTRLALASETTGNTVIKESDDVDRNEAVEADVAKATVRKFRPSTMNEQELVDMVKSSGLLQYSTFDEVPESLQRTVRKSCFPPTTDEVKRFNLDRCIRCLPQDNDTGGFFVALLKKTGPISNRDKREVQGTPVGSDEPDVKRARTDATDLADDFDDVGSDGDVDDLLGDLDEDNRPIRCGKKTNLVRDADGKVHTELGKDDFVEVKDDVLDPLLEFYGVTSTAFRKDLYMARAVSELKIIYYLAKPIKDLIDMGIQTRVTVINSGLKAFVRNSHNEECPVSYRIAQEGVHFFAPFMTQRKVVIGLDDFQKCLTGKVAELASFSQTFQDSIRPLVPGAFVVVLAGYEDKYEEKMLLTLWRCRGDKIDGLVAKVELDAIKCKLQAIERATMRS